MVLIWPDFLHSSPGASGGSSHTRHGAAQGKKKKKTTAKTQTPSRRSISDESTFFYYSELICARWCQTVYPILFTFSPPCSRICTMKCAFTVIIWHMITLRSSPVSSVRPTSSCLVTLWSAILVSGGNKGQRERETTTQLTFFQIYSGGLAKRAYSERAEG